MASYQEDYDVDYENDMKFRRQKFVERMKHLRGETMQSNEDVSGGGLKVRQGCGHHIQLNIV